MKKLLYILPFFVFYSCNENNQKKYEKKVEIDSISTKKVIFKKDTIYLTKDKSILLIGDKSKQEFKLIMKIQFEDFAIKNLFRGVKAKLVLNSNKQGQMYRTTIKDAYKKDINFAGHYCFVEWGCGSSCKESVIIDAETGKIYNGVNSAWGYNFRKDSRMLIVNPPDSNGNCEYSEVYGSTRIYIFDEEKKIFLEKK